MKIINILMRCIVLLQCLSLNAGRDVHVTVPTIKINVVNNSTRLYQVIMQTGALKLLRHGESVAVPLRLTTRDVDDVDAEDFFGQLILMDDDDLSDTKINVDYLVFWKKVELRIEAKRFDKSILKVDEFYSRPGNPKSYTINVTLNQSFDDLDIQVTHN
ncbi:hypothetical protein Noda2021_10440 [Candidatus Dependentiae bacterium Noda2021]|nr:hypothetical protein Noda2021_10440 [Candidatus Dependentiae bacterium Noda2021]